MSGLIKMDNFAQQIDNKFYPQQGYHKALVSRVCLRVSI